MQHQSGHADGRGGGKQRIPKGRVDAILRRDGKHQQQTSHENDQQKTEDDDPKRGLMILLKGLLRRSSPLYMPLSLLYTHYPHPV